MSLATQERLADIVQNAKQMVAEAVDKVIHCPSVFFVGGKWIVQPSSISVLELPIGQTFYLINMFHCL